jgi:hypothetical protein
MDQQKAEETVTKSNKDEDEDVESPATNNDISRHRLNHLKTVFRSWLWAEEIKTINADDLHKHVDHLVTINIKHVSRSSGM